MLQKEKTKCYENGFPVRFECDTPEELARKHPGAAKILMEERKEKFEAKGIFLDGFGKVSAMVFMDFRLHIWDILVFCAIKLFCGMDGHACIKVSTIRKATNLGARAVKEAIKNLERYGYLEIVTFHSGRGNRARSEFICIDNPKGLHGTYTMKGTYRGGYCEFAMYYDQWGRVSKAVFCDDSLDKYAKLVYVVLCILGEGNMSFTGRNADLSLLLREFTKERIQKALRHLQQRGYVEVFALCRGSEYYINAKPHNIPYPTMFFCNDISKAIKGERAMPERIPDISCDAGESVSIDDIVQRARLRVPLEKWKHQRNLKQAKEDYEDLLSSTPFYRESLVGEDPRLDTLRSMDVRRSTSKCHTDKSASIEALIHDCEEEDKAHPCGDFGAAYKRGYDLRRPETDFLVLVAKCDRTMRYGEVSEDEEIIWKITARGGIPEEFAYPENKAKLLRALELLQDAVPGIDTNLENKCLKQAIDTLKAVAEKDGKYKVNGEPVSLPDMVHALNKVLTVDDGGVTLSGFLQYVAKYAAANMLRSNVQRFKTAIVHMMESLCYLGKSLVPIVESERDYTKFLYSPLPLWHRGKSCWGTRYRIA